MSKVLLRDLGGFDIRFGLAADYHLLLRAATRHRPTTWSDVDVLYRAGGASETDVYRQLVRRHEARVDALGLGAAGSVLDRAWTWGQDRRFRARKWVKQRASNSTESPAIGAATDHIGPVPILRTTPTSLRESLVAGALPEPRHVHFTNAYSVVAAQGDPTLAATFAAGRCYPDGLPLVWALSRLWPEAAWARGNRVRGPDMFLDVLDAGQAVGVRHYLLGGAPDTLVKLRAAVADRFPDARVVGSASPPFVPVVEVDWDRYLAEIRASDADLVWVGLGTPKQDFVSALLAARDPQRTYLAVGAAFDFAAGTARTAPAWMQERGLEWLFRLLSEPRRLWRRYLIGNAQFLGIVARQLMLSRRLRRRRHVARARA